MSLLSKIYINYRYRIFPKISHIRGTTRLNQILQKAAWKGLEKPEREPTNITQKDWKNLIIIDACRADTYKEVIGDTDTIISVGSSSSEFIKNSYSKEDFSDTICITANPYYSNLHFERLTGKKAEEVFHEIFRVYETDWDEENNTVMPQKMVEKVKTAEKLWPEKRKIIHLMQPHYPFIENTVTGQGFEGAKDKGTDLDKTNVWDKAMLGIIEHEEIIDAYEKNLEYVMPFVEEIADNLTGKTVLTADHGNLIGEKGLYGHPSGCKAKGLTEVPWKEV